MNQTRLQRRFEKEIKKIRNELIEVYKPEKIILFGSCAYGKVRADSDIDMLIIKKSKKTRRERLEQVLNLVDYSLDFEPHVLTPQELDKELELGEFFIREAVRKGKVLYAKS